MDHVFRPLKGLPKRVIIDANVFMNSSFVAGCSGNLALQALSTNSSRTPILFYDC